MKQASGSYLPAGSGASPYRYRLTWRPASSTSVEWIATIDDGRLEFFLGGRIERSFADCTLEHVATALEQAIEGVRTPRPRPLRSV